MTFKEIIDAERWDDYGVFPVLSLSHNKSIDRIEDAVTRHIAELEAVLTGIANAEPKDWGWCEGMNKNERNIEFRAWVQSIARNAIKTQG